MRILLLNDYATPTAGAERLTRNLRDALHVRGHDVRVLATRAQLIPGDSFADVSCFGTTGRAQTLTSALNPWAFYALKRELRSFSPDVVQVHMHLWQLSPAILPLLRAVSSVYYAMTLKAVCPTGLKWLPSGVPCTERAGSPCLRHRCVTVAGATPLMLQRYLWLRGRSTLGAVVATSHAVRSQLAADGVVVRDVVWPGTPVACARPRLEGRPTVTYAGRLVPEKGVALLLRSFRRVLEHIPNARLYVAGTGPEEAALRGLVSALGLAEAVEMIGQLDAERIPPRFAGAWAHAVPSCWPEPFGLTATEAMMRGTAVVASDIGGLKDSVEHDVTGLKVAPGDERQLADALIRLLNDRELAERMGAAARQRAMRLFSMDRCVEEFEILYQQLLNPENNQARALGRTVDTE